jgi:hypothetical protein
VPWAIQLLSYFNILAPPSPVDNRLKADLYMEENGSSTGRFRWVLSCARHVTVTFKASQVIPGPREEDYDLTLAAKASDIKMAINMTSSPWMDLSDLVAKGHITVTQHGEDAAHSFLGKNEKIIWGGKNLYSSKCSLKFFFSYFVKFES